MTDINGVMMQYFQADLATDRTHWQRLQTDARSLAEAGFTAIWVPSAEQGSSNEDYLAALRTAQQSGLQVYTDVELIHKLSGYSSDTAVSPHCLLDSPQMEMQAELNNWGEWLFDTTGIDGFYLAEMEQARPNFFNEWLIHVRRYAHRKLFAVGEYWAEDVESLHTVINQTGGQFSLLDVPLHYNFHRASRASGHFDMRRILFGTLMREQPALAVTFVESHLSQPLQVMESVVEPWFKPHAYALILLRREGYPCVFYGDYYGGHYWGKGLDGKVHEVWLNEHRWLLDRFLHARHQAAHGAQYDYFDHPECIGWTRLGTDQSPRSLAVIMSDATPGSKWMEVGKPCTWFYDVTEHVLEPILTNESGWGEFACKGGSVSVWLEQ
jgi:alpha-amylase